MANSFDYFDTTELDPFDFIAGTYQELIFTVLDSDSALVNLGASTCSVIFSPYGNYSYASLTVSGSDISVSASPVNQFTASISSSYTKELEGKYTMQPQIIDSAGKEFRPATCNVLIIGRNGG